MKRLILLILLGFGPGKPIYAQERPVSGRVTSAERGDALPGVSVSVKGSTSGTTTDATGTYRFTVPNDATLVFSFIGMVTQQVEVGTRTVIDVALKEEISSLEEVVVTGLATSIKRSNLANAVSTVSGEELAERTSVQTLDAALQGRVAGANIIANSGAPGGGISVKLRGVSSITGSSEPLYIVDGVYLDNSAISPGTNSVTRASVGGGIVNTQDNPSNRIADLAPEDIANVEILKGASASAIYGARANAGVVIITTKRGREGKTQISFAQDLGVASALRLLGTRQLTEEKIRNNAFGPSDEAAVAAFVAARNAGQLFDYEKELFGNQGFIRESRINISGGNEKTKFFVAGNVRDEEGIIKRTGFSRNSIRANIDHKISRIFDVSINTNYIRSSADRGLTNNDNANVSLGISLANTPSYVNLFPDANGNYPNSPAGSNFLQTRDLSTINEQTNRFVGGGTLNINFFQRDRSYLRLSLNGGLDFFNTATEVYFPENLQFQISGPSATQGFYSSGNNVVFNTNTSQLLVFGTQLNKVSLTSSLGATQLRFNQNRATTQAIQLVGGQKNLEQAGALSVFNRRLDSQDYGYFFQQEANFNDQVIATAGIRLDKSSLIGDPNQLFAFPKASLAVNLNKFDFWGLETVSQLKIRAAYGQAGGIPSANPVTLQQPRFTVFGPGNISGLTGSVIGLTKGDPNIKPERSEEFETGLDVGLFENKVSLEATYYTKTVRDLILNTSMPPSSGYTFLQTNAGSLKNEGVELTLGFTPVNNGVTKWFSQFLFFVNRSKVTKLNVPTFQTGGFGNSLGQFQIEEGFSPTQIIGSIPGAEGQVIAKIGDAQPKFQLSWNNEITFLKNFQFSMLWHWKEGGENINLTQLLSDFAGTSYDYDDDDDGNGVINGEQRGNTLVTGPADARLFVQKSSYLKLRQATLYYTLPTALVARAFRNTVERIRIGVSGNNLLMFTNYNSYDPEVSNFGNNGISSGVEVAPYPSSRRMFFHVSVDF